MLPIFLLSITEKRNSARIVEILFNPFFPNATFFYPLKTSENRKVFQCFQGVEKGCIECVKRKISHSKKQKKKKKGSPLLGISWKLSPFFQQCS